MSDKVKILYLAANPRDTSSLRLQEEARDLEERIRSGPHGQHFSVVHYLAVRPRDLLRGLQEEQPHILHFSGHATHDNEIVFQNEEGTSQPISSNDLRDLVEVFPGNLRLVLLVSCFGQKHAEALIQVIDFAIGMNQPLSDKGAVSFSAAFYQILAGGGSVRQAFDGARVLTSMEGRPVFASSDFLVKPGANADQSFIKELRQENGDAISPPSNSAITRLKDVTAGDVITTAGGTVNISK